MTNNKQMLLLLCVSIAIGISACAHQSKVQPSTGHIDDASTASDKKSAYKKSLSPSTGSPSEAATANAGIPKPVTNSVYLPPPTPKPKEPTYSIVVYDTPVKEVLFAIARDSKFNVDIHPSIQGRVTLNAVDQTLPAILERLSKQVDLTYNINNNVLTIGPDKPFLRNYSINYVNMNRDTTGEISVSNQIASNSPVSINAGGGQQAAQAGGSQADNTSKTKVKSVSENHFWDSLIKNVTDILAESDKEVLVNRLGSDARLQGLYDVKAKGTGYASVNSPSNKVGDNVSSGVVSGAGNQVVEGNAEENSEKNLKNYKTLFAASVIPNKETGVLSIRASQKQHEKIQEFLDKVQTNAKRQVLIEATIVEVRLNDRFQAGVDWSRLGNGFTFNQATAFATPDGGPSSLVIGYATGSALDGLTAAISLLKNFGSTKVLSSPKLMVLNSQTAILKAVENLVYFTIQSTPANLGANGSVVTPAVITTTPQTVPIGVWMTVTPQINENGTVTINVRPTIARKTGEVNDPNPDLRARVGTNEKNIVSAIPQISVREMESVLQIPSGNTAILGGLMQDEIADNNNAVPGVSNVPIIGNAFKAKDASNTKTELVIFLRPTVISNASLESDELANYKQYLPAQQLKRTLESDADR